MKNLWIILIVGIILRIFLSFATFHPDILAFKLGGEVVASGKVLNLYDYSDENIAVLNYPPLIYWFFGLFNFLSANLGLLKLPYLIFDILIGLLLFKLFNSKKESILALALWIFNPISLYATYMMGQFDIIPTFFSLLSIYFIIKNKLYWGALALGFGIAFKLFPIFLVIPLAILGKTFWYKVKLVILTLLPYIISILPYLPSQNFRATALFANQTTKSLYAQIPVSGGEAILLFPAALLFLYLVVWRNINREALWRIYLIVLLLFFIFTHYHPQWLIWITPFLIIDLVVRRFKNLMVSVLIIASWIGSLFFFDPSLTVGLFAPLWPALRNMPSVWNQLHLSLDYNFLRSILQTVFAASAGYLIYDHFPKNNK